MRDDSVPFRAGDIVAGRYRVEALLGRGGFGVVYRAVQLNIGRAVALKMLLAEALAHREGIARFRREAELAQRLEHPNTVRLYDFGETEQGLPFIAWELLRGRPLDAVLRADGGLPPARVARIAAQILKALMEAHALGIVHRDVKPSNIFLCEFSGEPDFVKVLDFGIAKSLWDGPGLTRDGAIVGTPSYMPREQVSGQDLTPAADLYALGLVMAEALLGRPVFVGESGLALCMAQLSNAAVPLPRSVLASPLGDVIARATQKDAPARFATAAAMLAQLEESVSRTSAVGIPAVGIAAPAAPRDAGAGFVAATTMQAAAAPAPSPHVEPATPSPEAQADDLAGIAADEPPAQAEPALLRPTLPSGPERVSSPAELPLVSAPPVFVAPLPPPVAAPSPSRRALLLAGTAASVIAMGAVVAAYVIGNRERGTGERVVEPGHAARGHGTGVGSPVGHRFALLTAAQVRARIEDGNYRVAFESTTELATYWSLEPRSNGDANSVMLYRAIDAAQAEALYRVRKGQPGAVARDGTSVLYVQLPQHGAAEALLQRLIR